MKWLFGGRSTNGTIDPREAKGRQDAGSAVVVDVREEREWRSGHIPHARHIPLGQLLAHILELLAEPELIFVCRSGNRSASATRALVKAGHPNALNMTGGMIAWKGAQLPVTT
jgi:rhodanese-related sulfurtransferase